jgi:hypothetical protein
MNIKAYSFEQNTHAFAEVKRAVSEQLTEPGMYFESYSDAKALFTDISNSIDDADVLLIGIENRAYLKFKPILIKAFNFAPAYSDKINELIGDKVSDEKLKKAHALVPDESIELLSDDGLYSGFYVKDDDQYIVVFPLIDNVVPKILIKADLPFIRLPEEKTEIFNAIIDADTTSTKASNIIAKLKKYNFSLAIPATPAAKILKADVKECEDFESSIFFTPFVNDAGAEDPKQYAAQIAKSAMDLRSADLGATISNIFREKKGDKITSYYSYISVATADKVVVKKLFADPDESIDNLVIEATNELYSMIDKYIDELAFKLNATEDELAKYEQSLIEAEVVSDIRPEATVSRKGVIAAVVAIVIAVVLCVIFTVKYGGYFVKPSDAPANEDLQIDNIEPTIIASTDKPDSVKTTVNALTIADLTETMSDTAFNISTSATGISIPANIIQTDPTKPTTQAPVTSDTTPSSTTAPTETTTDDGIDDGGWIEDETSTPEPSNDPEPSDKTE